MESDETPVEEPITMEAIQRYKWPGPHDVNNVPDQNTLDNMDLEHQCVLDVGRHPEIGPGKESLGMLDTLPLEVVTKILSQLDIPTLTQFRQVNARGRHTVDFLHQYRTIVGECPNVLRAIVSTRATGFTLDSLYRTLFTEECTRPDCPLFGVYLNVLTGSRFCFEHFSQRLVLSARRIIDVTDVTIEQLKELPHMYNLSGRYTPRRLAYHTDMLVDRLTFEKWADLPLDTTRQLMPTVLDPNEWFRMMDLPYLVVVSAPFLKKPGPAVEWGFGCAVCERCWYGWLATVKGGTYTERGLLEHFIINGIPVDDDMGGRFHSAHLPGGEFYLRPRS